MEKLKGKRILVVDDDKRNTYALVNYLESLSMNVSMAENGQEAINMLEAGLDPAIILLDIMMPVMDGYETLAVLTKDESLKKIPVIVVTARAMTGDRAKCMKAGAWDYIAKPINLNELTNMITKWIL